MSHPENSYKGVTAPRGFSASSVQAGIKPSGKPDMALIVNEGPQDIAAAVFTRNKVCAAPVVYTRAHHDGHYKAILINAGNANAATGVQGLKDTQKSAEYTAELLNYKPEDIAVCSTGLIGDFLPMNKVLTGIKTLTEGLSSDIQAGHEAAHAIMTTDTVHKESLYEGQGWCIGAMAKGVGMMAPSLATMIVVITTDAIVQSPQKSLENACSRTFECIDIDGATSTNDTVLLLANGASGYEVSEEEFARGLQHICQDLMLQLQADAEGVTKRVAIRVHGASTEEEALIAARTVGRDNLFKCAMFGSDPNWGRVLAAVGMAPVEMDPEKIAVAFNGHTVCRNTTGVPGAREVDLSGEDILVEIDLSAGTEDATIYTTDLSYSYVEINSEYST